MMRGHGLKLFRLEHHDYTPLQTRHENGELDGELQTDLWRECFMG